MSAKRLTTFSNRGKLFPSDTARPPEAAANGWREPLLRADLESIWNILEGLSHSDVDQHDLRDLVVADIFFKLFAQGHTRRYLAEGLSDEDITQEILLLLRR